MTIITDAGVSCIVWLANLINIAHAATEIRPSKELLDLIRRTERDNNIPTRLLLVLPKTESNLQQPFALNIEDNSVLLKDKGIVVKTIKQTLSQEGLLISTLE